MKIRDELIQDGDKIIHARSFDVNPTLRSVQRLRDMGDRKDGNWHVGRIPQEMIGEWIKEAGLAWSDHEAVRDLIHRKLMSGEYDALRPKLGTF